MSGEQRRDEPEAQGRVLIFDTTLRDGEQAPGFSMSTDQKIRMAKTLAKLGVDVIEAGFAAASPGDFEAIELVAREVHGPIICSLARANENDIREAGKALREAKRRRIHTFIGTSPLHRERKLNMTPAQVLERARMAVERAREFADDVEFSAEDAIRTERDFLAEAANIAVEAGARTINIPDTVGYTTPEEIEDLFRFLRNAIDDKDVVLSCHCHDDLGLAVANSLAAVKGGARQIECTINGIGERAGNASMEEAVMAMRTRAELFGIDTAINARHFYGASRLLAAITGQPVPRNKAIVGRNAFAHESGIHQDGVIKDRSTYEIMKPEDVGAPVENLVLGKHSGRAAIRAKAESMGFELSDNELGAVFQDFKRLADARKEISDGDLATLIVGGEGAGRSTWRLDHLATASSIGPGGKCSATVRLRHADGDLKEATSEGDGPLDAAFHAIETIVGLELELIEFQLRSLSSGPDALGEAEVAMKDGARVVLGKGVNLDIVAAGALAVLDAVNRIEARRLRQTDQEGESGASPERKSA